MWFFKYGAMVAFVQDDLTGKKTRISRLLQQCQSPDGGTNVARLSVKSDQREPRLIQIRLLRTTVNGGLLQQMTIVNRSVQCEVPILWKDEQR